MPGVMWIPIADVPPPTNPLIQTVIQEEVPEPEPPPAEPALEEKIRTNHYNCNEETHWIRADNAQCLPKPVRTVSTTTIAQKAVRRAVYGSNSYSYGYCTWYVKNRLAWVPNGWGNANRWAANARAGGFTVSSKPVVGAVAQTSGGALGHVAVVTAVHNGTVTVSEMNFTGWNRVSSRTVPISSFVYIY